MICAALLIAILGAGSPVRGQALNLDAPEAPKLQADYLRQRLERVQREWQRLGGPERRPSDEPRALAWAAARQIRVMARDLLQAAIDDGTAQSSGVAVLGLKIAARAEDVDAVLAEVVQVDQIITADQKGQAELDRWRQAKQALAKFGEPEAEEAGAAENAKEAGKGVDLAKLRARVTQRLALLLPVFEAMGRPDATTTWLPAPSEGEPGPAAAPGGPGAAGLEAQLAQVTRRAGAIADADLKLAAEEAVAKVRAAKEFSDLRPRLEATLRLVAEVADLSDTLAEATWFGATRRTVLERELARGLTLYVQPGKRREATTRVQNTLAFLPALRSLAELRRRHIDAGPLEAAVGAATSLPDDPAVFAARGAVLAWVNAGAALQIERLGIDPASVGEMRSAYARLDMEFMRRWANLLAAGKVIAIQPNAASTPEATAPLASLRKMGANLQNVARLSDRVARAAKWSGRPSGELSTRLRAAAGELLTENDQAATALLERFARQVDRFTLLPGEAALREQEYRSLRSDWPSVGDRAQALLQVIDEQRGAWAQAWSTGQDPAAAQRAMEKLSRLLLTVRGLEALRDAEPALATLNRWGAVELDAAVLAPRIARALRTCERIVDAAVGMPASSLGTLELDRPDLPPALVAAGEAYLKIGPRLAKLPDDGSLLLSQTLFGPGPGSFWGDKADALALLARSLNEMPAQGGTPHEVLEAARQAAAKLLAEE